MRYTAGLAARAESWLARDAYSTGPEGKRSAEGLLELAAVWAAIQNVPLPNCIRQCQLSEHARDVAAYVQEYHRFTSTSAAMSDTKPTGNYQLAPQFAGQTFAYEHYGKTITADNLTDEDAEFFISKGHSDAFIARGGTIADEQPASGPDAPVTVANKRPLVPEADLTTEQTEADRPWVKSPDRLAVKATTRALKSAATEASVLLNTVKSKEEMPQLDWVHQSTNSKGLTDMTACIECKVYRRFGVPPVLDGVVQPGHLGINHQIINSI